MSGLFDTVSVVWPLSDRVRSMSNSAITSSFSLCSSSYFPLNCPPSSFLPFRQHFPPTESHWIHFTSGISEEEKKIKLIFTAASLKTTSQQVRGCFSLSIDLPYNGERDTMHIFSLLTLHLLWSIESLMALTAVARCFHKNAFEEQLLPLLQNNWHTSVHKTQPTI